MRSHRFSRSNLGDWGRYDLYMGYLAGSQYPHLEWEVVAETTDGKVLAVCKSAATIKILKGNCFSPAERTSIVKIGVLPRHFVVKYQPSAPMFGSDLFRPYIVVDLDKLYACRVG